jgi:outer membrane murein-binding lipoprotein Lpp
MKLQLLVCAILITSSAAAKSPSIKTPGAPACTARMNAVSEQISTLTDAHKKALLDVDMRHARKEAAEGDEAECAEYLDNADEILHPMR